MGKDSLRQDLKSNVGVRGVCCCLGFHVRFTRLEGVTKKLFCINRVQSF